MEIIKHTDRLIIRSWKEADIEPYAAMVADSEVMKHIGDGRPRSRDYAVDFVNRMMVLYDERGWIRFAIEHAESGELMGFCGFDSIAESGGVQDFGWRFARKFWGAGFGSEAVLSVLELGRGRYGLKNIESMSYPENIGSIKLFEKMGMTFLRESEEHSRRVVHYGFPDSDGP